MDILGKVKYIRSEIEKILLDESNAISSKYMSHIFIDEDGEVFKYVLELGLVDGIYNNCVFKIRDLIEYFINQQDIQIRISIRNWENDRISPDITCSDNKFFQKGSQYGKRFIQLKQTNYNPKVKDVMILYDYDDKNFIIGLEKLKALAIQRDGVEESCKKEVEVYLSGDTFHLYNAMSTLIQELVEELDDNVIII